MHEDGIPMKPRVLFECVLINCGNSLRWAQEQRILKSQTEDFMQTADFLSLNMLTMQDKEKNGDDSKSVLQVEVRFRFSQ